MLLFASVNALSYFARSDGWGNLLGTRPQHREALGFPWEVWEEGNTYGGFYADYPALLANVAVGAALSSLAGLLFVALRADLDRMLQEFIEEFEGGGRGIQFSLRGLFALTLLAAVLAALVRYVATARPEFLAAIYGLGPWVLIGVTLVPRQLSLQQRVIVLTPLTILGIVAAVLIGARLERPLLFDEVLLGIFVCWTPQCALAAIGLAALIFVQFRRRAASVSR